MFCRISHDGGKFRSLFHTGVLCGSLITSLPLLKKSVNCLTVLGGHGSVFYPLFIHRCYTSMESRMRFITLSPVRDWTLWKTFPLMFEIMKSICSLYFLSISHPSRRNPLYSFFFLIAQLHAVLACFLLRLRGTFSEVEADKWNLKCLDLTLTELLVSQSLSVPFSKCSAVCAICS